MHLLIFGLGYTAGRLADRLRQQGWQITATTRSGRDGTFALESNEVKDGLKRATHILSSVPPASGIDPIIARYTQDLTSAPAGWIGYLSSTGVYGDTGGAWVDEHAELAGRRRDRIAADLQWQALRPDVRVFRLPGIYGPGRSAVDQVKAGTAHRVDAPAQRFSRIHVDDIVAGVISSFSRGGGGPYNLCDMEPASGASVVEYACDLLGYLYPPFIRPDSPLLSPIAQGFYTESRVVATARARRELGFTPIFPSYRQGLRACLDDSPGR